MYETIKRLTDKDLASVYGGQIYKVEGTDTFEGLTYKAEGTRKNNSLYFVPNEIGFFIYATEEAARWYSPKFVITSIIKCSSAEEAAERSMDDAGTYSVTSVFPFI